MRKILSLSLALMIIIGAAMLGTAAEPSGKLSVLIIIQEGEGKAVIEGFKKLYPKVAVDSLRMSASEGTARIKAEKIDPTFDIILGGPSDNFEILKKEKALLQYKPANAKEIPTDYQDNEGYWYGLYVGPLAIAINTKRYQEKGYKEKLGKDWSQITLEDLTKVIAASGIKDVTVANPKSSGTAKMFISGLWQYYNSLGLDGKAKTKEWYKALHPNVGNYQTSGTGPVKSVSQGEFTFCITPMHDVYLYKLDNPAIGVVEFKEAGWEIGAVGAVANSPNQVNAKLFMDYLTSAAAGNVLSSYSQKIPCNSNSEGPTVGKPLSKTVYFKAYSYDFTTLKDAEIKELFSEITGL